MATTLTSAELQRLRNMFEELDVDDSGDVSIAELRTVMESQRADLSNLESLLATLDLDGDGTVDYKEFVAACIQEQTLYNQDRLATPHP